MCFESEVFKRHSASPDYWILLKLCEPVFVWKYRLDSIFSGEKHHLMLMCVWVWLPQYTYIKFIGLWSESMSKGSVNNALRGVENSCALWIIEFFPKKGIALREKKVYHDHFIESFVIWKIPIRYKIKLCSLHDDHWSGRELRHKEG